MYPNLDRNKHCVLLLNERKPSVFKIQQNVCFNILQNIELFTKNPYYLIQ